MIIPYAIIMMLQLYLCVEAIRAFIRIYQDRRHKLDFVRFAIGLDMAASFHNMFWGVVHGEIPPPTTIEGVVALVLKTATLLFLIRVMHLKERGL